MTDQAGREAPHPSPITRRTAMTITTTTIVGNLTRDPEIRYTRDGPATTSLSVAVNRRWQDRTTKEWEERTKVEIVADEIGASLGCATVDIHKVQRPATADEPADEAASA